MPATDLVTNLAAHLLPLVSDTPALTIHSSLTMDPLGGTFLSPHAALAHADGDEWRMTPVREREGQEGEPSLVAVSLRSGETGDLMGDFTLSVGEALAVTPRWWSIPDRADRNRDLATAARTLRSLDIGVPPAVTVFRRTASPEGLQWATNRRPDRSDGRFSVAEHLEPYPGAWPASALDRALDHDDLTALWPYLGDR